MPQNPFGQFHPVPTAQDLLDYAFKRASTSNVETGSTATHLQRARKKEIERITTAIDYLTDRLQSIVKSVPNLQELPDFYRELSHLLVDNDQLKLNLGKLSGVVGVLKKLRREFTHPIKYAKNPHDAEQARVQAFGRISSVIAKQKDTLEFLDLVQKSLKKIPIIESDELSIVVAGYPNVGKSSLVAQISTGRPEIAPYPFTTKEIGIGHYYSEKQEDRFTKFARFQIIDTPGILDRPMATRNEIEKQAILALRRLADGIIFIFDPTETCGFELPHQVNLFKEVRTSFPNTQIIIVYNKMDLFTEDQFRRLLEMLGDLKDTPSFKVNAKTGEHSKDVLEYILNLVKQRYQKKLMVPKTLSL